jgi:hypothetical protein
MQAILKEPLMIRRSLLLSSLFSCAFAWGCNGRIDLGTGSLDSGAAAEGGVPFGDASSSTTIPDAGGTTDACTQQGCTGTCLENYHYVYPVIDGCVVCSCAPDDDAGDDVDESADSSGGVGTCPSISINVNPTVPRFPDTNPNDNPKNTFPSRTQLDPGGIDYYDCSSNIHLQFSGSVGGLPCTDTMQIWAGTADCTQTSARQANSGAVQCWPVTQSVGLQSAFSLNIRAQDLVAFIENAKPPSTYAPQSAAACQPLDDPSNCGAVSLGLYFMAIEADGLTVDGTPAQYSIDAIFGSPDGGLCGP